MGEPSTGELPAPLVVACQGAELSRLLEREWLLTNRLGAYASCSVAGCNTRRYHGLLIAATAPPVGRVLTLATVMERLVLPDGTRELATSEFVGTFSPRGVDYLAEFRNDLAPTYVWRVSQVELIKEIMLAESANTVAVRYTLHGADATLRVQPFVALRDYHHLRSARQPHQMTFQHAARGVAVQDRLRPQQELSLISLEGQFEGDPQWWYQFRYRADAARGQDSLEDLYTPGHFLFHLADGQSCQLTGTLVDPIPLDFTAATARRRERLADRVRSLPAEADETSRRLAAATDAFVVQRSFLSARASATIVGGYHWFADWGRDAFIALPGLLLATGRYEQARQVFRTFANALADGMIPNRFDDYGAGAHYNSIDASLWFIVAAERYLAATNDQAFWRDTLMPTAHAILKAYQDGTRFDIHADADALLTGGSAGTQLTWMDAALGQEVITPRHGKAVEVNALWHSAHRIMAQRCRDVDDQLAEDYRQSAELIRVAFAQAFWNETAGCLFDCIRDDQPDDSIRPNQILAVSLPHSPLERAAQVSVVKVVTAELLTPYGLRTLSPANRRYRRRYGGSWESRDRAYHQGTVWAWLIGPFIEAHLKVHGTKPLAVQQAKGWLRAFDAHLAEAGLGYISEIFDGEAPHTPRGCIAQAWSVAEVLRAKLVVAEYEKNK